MPADKNPARKITHGDISNLLLGKHSEDICVPECNTKSSTQHPGCQRIDFWAMKKSWAHPTVWAYEIKTSRADFIQDNKWQGYLDYCTDFYFIAPPGIIEPEELPPEAGLIVCSKNAKRLYTKKKAPHRRDVNIPDTIYRYILFSRSTIDVPDRESHASLGVEYYKDMLEDRDENTRVGSALATKISILVRNKVSDVVHENSKLRNEIQTYDSFTATEPPAVRYSTP